MLAEMNWVYAVGIGTLSALLLQFTSNRVPVRQKHQWEMRK
jgi:hypothetical protein